MYLQLAKYYFFTNVGWFDSRIIQDLFTNFSIWIFF